MMLVLGLVCYVLRSGLGIGRGRMVSENLCSCWGLAEQVLRRLPENFMDDAFVLGVLANTNSSHQSGTNKKSFDPSRGR
jgi:hypothetical protein